MAVCRNMVQVRNEPAALRGGIPLPRSPLPKGLDHGGIPHHLGIRGVDACKALGMVLSLLTQSKRSMNVRRSHGSKVGFLSEFVLNEQAPYNFG